ncbi:MULTISPECIES: hypothetical protein [unclassified Streptomyces]|uniref:hypothetical protein n=1 Tax=unclassified Streptomyces TaxID=2593676 RepID=UPI00378FA0B2
MAFEDEWEQLKADARDRRSSALSLNGTGNQPPGAQADLVVQQDDLGAVGSEAYRLHGELRERADLASAGSNKDGAGTTARAAAELRSRNFNSGGELYTTLEVWQAQVRTVLQMCAHISNHLDYSKKSHAKDDAEIAADLRRRDGSAVPVSELLKYVK